MDSTRERELRYARAIQSVYDRLTVDEDHEIALAVMAVADAEIAEWKHAAREHSYWASHYRAAMEEAESEQAGHDSDQ